MRSRILGFIIVLLAILGFADAIFLYVQEDRGTVGQFCEVLGGTLGANCQKVLQSTYAEVAGLKLTVWGVLYYFSLLWLAVWARVESPSGGRLARWSLAGLSSAGFFISGYLTYLQAKVIGAWCPFCLISAGITTLIALFSIWNLRCRKPAELQTVVPGDALAPAAESCGGGMRAALGGLAVLAVLLAAGLVITLLSKRPQDVKSTLEEMMPFVPRRVAASGGLVYGYDTAAITVQAFLDFTCNYCRIFERETFPKLRPVFIDSGRVKWVNKLLPHSNQGAPLFFAAAAVCGRGLPESHAIEYAFFTYPIPSEKTGVDAVIDALTTGGISAAVADTIAGCFRDEKRLEDIRSVIVAEVNQAVMGYGLKGPPAFVIDGIGFQGTMDLRTMSNLLEIFLQPHGK